MSSVENGNGEGCKRHRAQGAKRRVWRCEDRNSGKVPKVRRAKCQDAEKATGAKVCTRVEGVRSAKGVQSVKMEKVTSCQKWPLRM